MSWASAEYERQASDWDHAGRPEPSADPWSTMVMGCWIGSAGATQQGVSMALRAYHQALSKVLDRRNVNWLDDLFGDREYCRFCGESWRTENCGICTGCSATFPPCCGDKRGFVTLANGNRECPSCHRGELVG